MCQAKFWEDFSPVSEVESVDHRFCVRVPAVSASVPVVTVPLSNVNVVGEVVLSGLDCEFVEPQTLTRSVFLWNVKKT